MVSLDPLHIDTNGNNNFFLIGKPTSDGSLYFGSPVLTDDVWIPVYITWLVTSSELTDKRLSTSVFNVNGRIDLDVCNAGLVWRDLVPMYKNFLVCVVWILVMTSKEEDGDGRDAERDNDDVEVICVDSGNCGDSEDGCANDDDVW